MKSHKVKIGEEYFAIKRYEIAMGFDCVVYTDRTEALGIADAVRNVRPVEVSFFENDELVANASLVFRQEHLEADDEGTRGMLAFFVVNYIPV